VNKKSFIYNKETIAYLIGVALGDGNLSNPNGRATRLRVSCDLKYPKLIDRITKAIDKVLPSNKIALVKTPGNCVNISSYSNKWESILGWKAKGGSKFKQNVSTPAWVWVKLDYLIPCLKGLLETDASLYSDRGYQAIMFTNIIPELADDVYQMITLLGFNPKIYTFTPKSNFRVQQIFRVRLSKDVNKFLNIIGPLKI
jgi:DNA-binding transcriptional regulator WhiA